MFGSTRSSLRIEKNQLKSEIKSIEKNLNKNAPYSRKYQEGLDRITKLKNKLIEIESKIRIEAISLDNSPYPSKMNLFHSPPSKAETSKASDFNITFTEHHSTPPRTMTSPQSSQPEQIVASSSQPSDITPIIDEPTATSANAEKTITEDIIQISGAVGGTKPKRFNFSNLPITSEQLTNLFSLSKTSHSRPQEPQVTQFHKKQITFGNPIGKNSTWSEDDFYLLKPPNFPATFSTFDLPSSKRSNKFELRKPTTSIESQKNENDLNISQTQFDFPTPKRVTHESDLHFETYLADQMPQRQATNYAQNIQKIPEYRSSSSNARAQPQHKHPAKNVSAMSQMPIQIRTAESQSQLHGKHNTPNISGSIRRQTNTQNEYDDYQRESDIIERHIPQFGYSQPQNTHQQVSSRQPNQPNFPHNTPHFTQSEYTQSEARPQNQPPQNLPIEQLQSERMRQTRAQYARNDQLQFEQNRQNAQNEQPQFEPNYQIQYVQNEQPQFQPNHQIQAQYVGNQQPQFERMQYQNQNVKPRDTFLRRLRSIPKFNGESFAQMKEFIDVVESLFVSTNNQSEENELNEQILLQLRGEARNLVLSLNNQNWDSIKSNLLKYFSYLANKEILSSQLENARQEENESLNTYADRVRKLLRDKNATYSYMTEEQKLEHNRVARRSFSKGISNLRLRNRLVTRGASSLEDAIAYAIEAENDDMNYIPPAELFCRSCNQSGHRSRNCSRSFDRSNVMNKLISALRAIGGNRQNLNSNNLGRGFNATQRINNFRNGNMNQNRDFNFMPNRNWNPNGASNRNFNGAQNRNWYANNPNNNWNTNNNFNRNANANRNWNQNQSQNWNQNPNWNSSRNSIQAQNNEQLNRNQNNGTNAQNQNSYNQRRMGERQRQNNVATLSENVGSTTISTSDSSVSEN